VTKQHVEVKNRVSADNSVLLIACSDGLQSTPQQAKGRIIHRIHRPGGALWSELLSRSPTKNRFVNIVLRALQLHRLHKLMLDHSLMSEARLMVEFKSPKKIFVTGHDPCTAAKSLGMEPKDVKEELTRFAEKLAKKLGDGRTPIEVLGQDHCTKGSWHYSHESYAVIAAGGKPALAEVA
jgi:hypothetical protein